MNFSATWWTDCVTATLFLNDFNTFGNPVLQFLVNEHVH